MVRATISFASIVLLALFVNAASKPQTVVSSKKLDRFIKQFSSEAKDETASVGYARVLDVSTQVRIPTKAINHRRADDYARACQIFFEPESGRKICLVLSVSRKLDPENEENHFFKISPDGKLQLVVFGRSFYKDGLVVKGAGKSEKVDPDAPGVQDELKRELDFWLSGKYRETPAKAAPIPATK